MLSVPAWEKRLGGSTQNARGRGGASWSSSQLGLHVRGSNFSVCGAGWAGGGVAMVNYMESEGGGVVLDGVNFTSNYVGGGNNGFGGGAYIAYSSAVKNSRHNYTGAHHFRL